MALKSIVSIFVLLAIPCRTIHHLRFRTKGKRRCRLSSWWQHQQWISMQTASAMRSSSRSLRLHLACPARDSAPVRYWILDGSAANPAAASYQYRASPIAQSIVSHRGVSKSPTRDPKGRPRPRNRARTGLGPGTDRSRSRSRSNDRRRSYSRSRSTSSSRSTTALFPDAAPQFRYVRRRGVQSTTRSVPGNAAGSLRPSYSRNDASQGKTSGDAANYAFGKRRGGGRPTRAA